MISGLVFQYGRTDCASAPYGGSQSLPINMIFLNMISGLVFQYGRMDCASAPYGGTQSLTINIIFFLSQDWCSSMAGQTGLLLPMVAPSP